MAKHNGRFTKEAAKNYKKTGSRVFCWMDGKDVYISDTFSIFRMNEEEYNEIMLPAVKQAAGTWILESGIKTDGKIAEDRMKGLVTVWKTAVDQMEAKRAEANPAPMGKAPFLYNCAGQKKQAAAYYNEHDDISAIFDNDYVSAFAYGVELYTDSPIKPAVGYVCGEPVAMICPMRIDKKISRAVRAYFVGKDDAGRDAEAMQIEYSKKRDELIMKNHELENEIKRLQAELESKSEKPAEAAPAESCKKQTAEDVKAEVEKLGVKAKINGANTKAPVVWIENGEKHESELKAAGALYSRKYKMYYIAVA